LVQLFIQQAACTFIQQAACTFIQQAACTSNERVASAQKRGSAGHLSSGAKGHFSTAGIRLSWIGDDFETDFSDLFWRIFGLHFEHNLAWTCLPFKVLRDVDRRRHDEGGRK
jgi:hypothetical protein